MKNIYKKSGRFSLILLCVSLLATAGFAQISLRDALDYDGDDKADYAVFRPSNNTYYIMNSGGGVTFRQFGKEDTDFQVPGDYDGDGRGDVAVWRATTGVWYVLNSSNNTVSTTQFGLVNDEPVARDYDGDGKTDLAVVRRTSSNAMIWYILRSSDRSFSATQFGLASDFVAPGDYDGDKKFDLAVQRTGANSGDPAFFYIRNSSSGNLRVTQWGLSDDAVVPGDYDGDGKTDIAVVREGNALVPGNLIWYILRSSDGSFQAVAYGDTTDLNAQNDYDGDGKTDIAVWRESNGRFYVRNSSGGSNVVNWGVSGDYPIAAYDAH